jgi:uncharacterized membrane protein YkoI
MPPKRTIIAAVTSVALIGLLYAGLVLSEDNGDAQQDAAEIAEEAAAQAEAKLTLEEAVALAEKQIPGGKVIESEVDTENGVASYVIDIEKDGLQTVMIAVRTGEVLSVGAVEDDDHEPFGGFFRKSP